MYYTVDLKLNQRIIKIFRTILQKIHISFLFPFQKIEIWVSNNIAYRAVIRYTVTKGLSPKEINADLEAKRKEDVSFLSKIK